MLDCSRHSHLVLHHFVYYTQEIDFLSDDQVVLVKKMELEKVTERRTGDGQCCSGDQRDSVLIVNNIKHLC